MNRREFIGSAAACAVLGPGLAEGRPQSPEAARQQALIDDVSDTDYYACYHGGEPTLPALKAYDAALDRAVAAIGKADVSRRPAVFFVYNMGILVRTKERFFSVDLCHRRGHELADRLDFALITHNHDDHYTTRFLNAMDRRGKTVVNNFSDNYGAYFGKRNPGGYTRGGKTFTFGDVTVRTGSSDHNKYLLDYVMPFEIAVGDFTIYHTGDSSEPAQLNPTRAPDVWFVHPQNGLNVVEGARKLKPKLTAVVHLNEMGHAKDRWRWSYACGETHVARLRDAGFAACMPLWGESVA